MAVRECTKIDLLIFDYVNWQISLFTYSVKSNQLPLKILQKDNLLSLLQKKVFIIHFLVTEEGGSLYIVIYVELLLTSHFFLAHFAHVKCARVKQYLEAFHIV